MAGNKAEISIGLTGTDQVVAGASRVKSAMGNIGKEMAGVAKDALRVATAMKTVNFAAAADEAKRYEETLSRMSGRAGQDVDQLKTKFAGLSQQILTSQAAQADFSRSLGRITYDAKGSVEAVKGLGEAALAMGRSLDDMGEIGATLRNSLGVVGDTTQAMGRLRAEAERAGIDWTKFTDAMASSSGALERVGLQSDGTKNKVLAMAAALGQGLSKGGVERVTSGAIGTLEGRALDVERMLGKRILNEHGQVDDPLQTMKDIQARVFKRLGKGSEGARRALIASFGTELGSQIFNAKDLQGAAPVDEGAASAAAAATAAEAERFRQSKGGQTLARQVGMKDAELGVGGYLTSAQNAVGGVLGNSPAAMIAAGYLGPAAGRAAIGAAKGLLGGGAAGGGAAAGGSGLAAGATGLAASQAALAAEGGAGLSGLAAGATGLAASQAALAAEGGAGLSGLIEAGLYDGTLAAGGGVLATGSLLGAAAFQAKAIGSLDKNSAFAQDRRQSAAEGVGKEVGEEAKRKGYLDMDLLRKARTVEGGEKEMIKYLSMMVDRLPPDLAAQIGAAVAEQQRQNAPLQAGPAAVEAAKATNPKP